MEEICLCLGTIVREHNLYSLTCTRLGFRNLKHKSNEHSPYMDILHNWPTRWLFLIFFLASITSFKTIEFSHSLHFVVEGEVICTEHWVTPILLTHKKLDNKKLEGIYSISWANFPIYCSTFRLKITIMYGTDISDSHCVAHVAC